MLAPSILGFGYKGVNGNTSNFSARFQLFPATVNYNNQSFVPVAGTVTYFLSLVSPIASTPQQLQIGDRLTDPAGGLWDIAGWKIASGTLNQVGQLVIVSTSPTQQSLDVVAANLQPAKPTQTIIPPIFIGGQNVPQP